MSFLSDDYLLTTPTARELYHGVAKSAPIIDYHNHLSPKDIAENRRFDNLAQIWLEGDHYKWRAMRAAGVNEDLITGKNTTDLEKFKAWAGTVPKTLRNPLYTWTHLELRRHFGINDLLDASTADKVWHDAREQLAHGPLTVHGILKKMNVEVVCTTDDPADDLVWHRLAAQTCATTKVLPTFRPDKAFTVDDAKGFNAWCDKLAATANTDIADFAALLSALSRRHDEFHATGCRLTDHGLETPFATECTDAEATAIFAKVRAGTDATPEEKQKFGTAIMLHVARLNATKGWTMQLHIGAIRNLNTRLLRRVGADAGVDSVGDGSHARPLAWFLDRLDRDGVLPKTIIYNLNPRDNALVAAMIGCFQDGVTPGKVQFGSGWWFLDQEDGMRAQIEQLSQLGLLSQFVGMLTDSRSFLSFPRHELFRRILCGLLGDDVATGRIPDRPDYLRPMVAGICHDNAARYFGF